MVFDVPTDRRARLWAVADEFLTRAQTSPRRVSARLASRVAGHILSLFLALGVITRLRTRYLYRDIRPASLGQQSWDSMVSISEEAYADVLFWRLCLPTLPPTPIHAPPPQPRHVFYTDAGEDGWGATFYQGSGYLSPPEAALQPPPLVAHDMFAPAQRLRSSTYREYVAVLNALRSFGHLVAGSELLIRTDSQTLVRIWHKGGSQRVDEEGELFLHDLVCALDSLVKELNLRPHLQWVPRDLNELADFWSKFQDPGDWMLEESIFAELQAAGARTLWIAWPRLLIHGCADSILDTIPWEQKASTVFSSPTGQERIITFTLTSTWLPV